MGVMHFIKQCINERYSKYSVLEMYVNFINSGALAGSLHQAYILAAQACDEEPIAFPIYVCNLHVFLNTHNLCCS
jgi:hypothetical protein